LAPDIQRPAALAEVARWRGEAAPDNKNCANRTGAFSDNREKLLKKFGLPWFNPIDRLHCPGQCPQAATVRTSSEIGYNSKVEGDLVVTRLDAALNWFRKNSVWPMPMGLACCAIELMAAGASRYDISRFGAEVMRFSPRQSDVMIVSGTVTYKMARVVKRVYDQMTEPKWVIAMGACASTGGMYRSYSVLQGVDRILPVNVYVAGCPPRPEALLDALIKLQEQVIAKEPVIATLKVA